MTESMLPGNSPRDHLDSIMGEIYDALTSTDDPVDVASKWLAHLQAGKTNPVNIEVSLPPWDTVSKMAGELLSQSIDQLAEAGVVEVATERVWKVGEVSKTERTWKLKKSLSIRHPHQVSADEVRVWLDKIMAHDEASAVLADDKGFGWLKFCDFYDTISGLTR
jgi:hypothetical protein